MYAYTTVNCVIWRRSRSEHVATVMITQSERIDVRYQCTLKLHKSMEYWYFMQTFGATAAALRQIYISGCTLSPNQTTDYYDYVLSIEDLWNSPSNRIDNNILPFHIKRLSTFFPLRSPSFWIHRFYSLVNFSIHLESFAILLEAFSLCATLLCNCYAFLHTFQSGIISMSIWLRNTKPPG